MGLLLQGRRVAQFDMEGPSRRRPGDADDRRTELFHELHADREGDLFYFRTARVGPTTVEFYDFATARRKVLFAVQKSFTWGLALSPDGRWLVHGLEDHVSSNLMLIEDLR